MAWTKRAPAVAAGALVVAVAGGYLAFDDTVRAKLGRVDEWLQHIRSTVVHSAGSDQPSDTNASGRTASSQADASGGATSRGSTAEGTATAVSFAELAPTISLVADEGAAPEAIRIQFARALTADTSARVPDATRIELDPEVKGRLSYDGDAAIRFVPDAPFAFGRDYIVRVASVAVNGQIARAPSADAAARGFSTPAFKALRAALQSVDETRGIAEVVVTFSGAIDHGDLAAHSTWSLAGGVQSSSVRWKSGLRRNQAIAELPLAAFPTGGEVRLTVKRGMPATARAAEIDSERNFGIPMPKGKDIVIKQVAFKEGVNGYFVQVICDDVARRGDQKAGGANQVYHYDYETHEGMYLSDRCQLDESTLRGRLRFIPETQWSLAPSRGGFRILGEFHGGELAMAIDSGVQSIDGGILKTPLHQTFIVPPRKPSVSFAAQGRYLPRSSWKNLGLRHLNVEKALVEARVIPPQNLAFWLGAEDERADKRLADVIFSKEIALSGKVDQMTTTWLDLQTIRGDAPHGVIELSITDLPTGKATDRKRLIVTNLNLVAKRSKDGASTQAWALDVHSNNPVPGVRLKLIVPSGRAVTECETGGDGGCALSYDKQTQLDQAEPLAIVAQRGDDLTYIRFSDLKTEVSETIVQGRPFSGGESPYRAAFWSDRGAYRPGETVHLGAVVRGQDDVAPAAGMPIELRLFDPREKLSRKQALTVDTTGFVEAALKFDAHANTGRYRAGLFVGGREIGRYSFHVEEFVPERMQVDVAAAQTDLLASDGFEASVTARYLFGGSAEGSRVELECEMLPSDFVPAANANFTYGVWYPDAKDKPRALSLGSFGGKLDGDGTVRLACPTRDESGGFTGAAKLRARAVVFEGESGRSSQKAVEVPVHPDKFYVGLTSGQKQLKRGDTLTYQGIVVDWRGDPVTVADKSTVEIELVRLESEWDWSYDGGEGDSSYRRFLRQVSEGRAQVKVVAGRFQGEIKIPNDASGYLLRAKLGKARTDLELKGEDDYWWYPSESTRDQTPRPFKPQWLDLADAPAVSVGEDLVVRFDAPYKGRLLLTAETDRLVASEWRQVAAGPVEWRLPIKQFSANIYASAFLIKDPHIESTESYLPDRAFGVRSYRIAPRDYRHELLIKTPTEIRPNSPLAIEVELKGDYADDAYVTVAAVDEGVLSLTRFATPDPLATLFEPRALGIETFETIGWNVMLPGAGTASSTGGDGVGDDAPVQLIKPVALWSGPVKLDGGKASVRFEVPQYRGQLRVMAVSFDRQRVGSASSQVLVRDPLVLQTTLPRFLTDGDDVLIPVSVTNMSGKDQNIKVTLTATGATDTGAGAEAEGAQDELSSEAGEVIRVEGKTVHELPLAAGKGETVVFRAVTRAMVGAAFFSVKADAGGYVSHEDLEVPIIPAVPRTRSLRRLTIGGDELNLKPELGAWLPGTERTSVWVTANPYADSLGHLAYLVHYPYGCIEQTTSSTRPLLVLRDVLQDADPSLLANGASIDELARAGIERVLSMQTPAGGFGYWPGDETPTLWGTAYAAHMLLDAQALGFPVPKERVDDAVQWLNDQIVNTFRYLSEDETEQDGSYELRHAAPYMHYVLARAGKSYKADIQKLIERTERRVAKVQSYQEGKEELYLLKAALWLAGDRRYEADLKSLDVSPLSGVRRNTWQFYSDLRYRGMMLSIFTDLFQADAAAEPLADLVAEALRRQRSTWYTTQELVWATTGLGKRISKNAAGLQARLLVDGKERKPTNGAARWLVERASQKGKITLKVAGAQPGSLFALLASDGVKDPPDLKTGGNGLEIKRVWRKADGSLLSLESDVKLGEIVFTELTIRNTAGEAIQNIALVDRLPAAFEIENPNLSRGTTAAFVDGEELWKVAYLNVRDDRLELFGALQVNETRKFWYASRAVVSGHFQVPPIEAEAMYDPQKWARETGGKLNVKGPWQEYAAQ